MLALAPSLDAKPARTAHGASGRSPNDPRALLRKMLAAETKIAYAGSEVTQLAEGPQSEQKVKCDPRLGLRRESVRPLGDLFVDDLRHSWFVSKRRGRMYERASRRAERGRAIQSALRRIERGELPVHYDGRDVVAGRETHIVRLGRADGGRGPARRFWIDAQTGLRLKTEEIGPQGRVLSSSYFLKIDLHPRLSRADFQRPATPPGVRFERRIRESFRTIREAQAHMPFALRAPKYLPRGYTLREVYVTRFGEHRVAAQRYTNGLSTITLFQTNAANAEMPGRKQRPPRAGSDPMPRRAPQVRTWRAGSLAFTLIGDLPEAEMARIAASVR